MSQPAEALDTAAFDPLPTLMDGEKYFALLGRDPLSPPFQRLYAAVIEGNYDRVPGLAEAIVRAGMCRMPRPHKDASHAASARKLADEMELWYRQNMAIRPAPQHVAAGSAQTLGAPTDLEIAEIKAARPPVEPEEAT